MPDSRPDIPRPMVRAILVEAGHRCSIPTCRAHPVELAHIDAWAKVREHKPDNLIALCPTCHTRYDKGEIDRQSMLIYKQQNRQLQQQVSKMLTQATAPASRSDPTVSDSNTGTSITATSLFEEILNSNRVELGDYELVWPAHLFAEEAVRIMGGSQRSRPDTIAISQLLREAFRDGNVAADFEQLDTARGFGNRETTDLTPDAFVRELVVRVHEIPLQSTPRAYWKQPSSGSLETTEPDYLKACREWANLIQEFSQSGYLEQAFPNGCVDDEDAPYVDRSAEIERRIGVSNAWPLVPDSWDQDTFFGLMEVFHDLVSRPRAAEYHSYQNCGMHYWDFATVIGRKLYRWRVNRILSDAHVPYRLGEVGEVAGRIVSVE
ncbi:HNH endonuclease signature motif containing protein [Spirillospora sp. NPDC052242]